MGVVTEIEYMYYCHFLCSIQCYWNFDTGENFLSSLGLPLQVCYDIKQIGQVIKILPVLAHFRTIFPLNIMESSFIFLFLIDNIILIKNEGLHVYITTRLYLSWLLVRRQIEEYYSIGDLALLLRLEVDNVYKYLPCQYIFFLSHMIVVHDGLCW